jgi:hypothetical protein
MKLANLAALLLLAASAPAWSAPVISLNWGSCTGPAHQPNTGARTYSLYVSVTGIDRPHKAYEVWLGFATAGDTTPDAWVFDPTGCQPEALVDVAFEPERALRTACPALSDGKSKVKYSKVRLRPAAPYGTMQLLVADAYPAGVTTYDPKRRYLLARIDFDHAASVEGPGVADSSCGGFEQEILFRAQPDRCNYQAMDGAIVPLECGKGAVLASFGGPAKKKPR